MIFIKKSYTFFAALCLMFSYVSLHAQDATVTVDESNFIYSIPDDLFGYNGTIWDGYQAGSTSQYNNLLKNAGFKVMRWPGGSWGDAKAWNNTQCDGSWIVSYAQSKALYKSLGIKFQPIVNFSGFWCSVQHTSTEANQLAAYWVTDGALDATYWEIGNEIMGAWEQGQTNATDYGNRFADFDTAMKSVNPNIKIIAVGDQHDNSDAWTRKLLRAAKAKGVIPEGFQIHNYPGSGGDYQLLHADLDAIGTWTQSLNTIVAQETGKGQLDYCMTEFGASGNNRWIKMIGGQLGLQYLMEMANNKWPVANVFGEIYNTSNFRAAPIWYVYAFLNGKYGRDVVKASSTNIHTRAYASRTSDSCLTIWVCNNDSTKGQTVKVNVSNFLPSSSGTIWIMEGANKGGQNAYDIAINGIVHPSESTAMTMDGNAIATGPSFNVTLPKSSMALIKLTPSITGITTLKKSSFEIYPNPNHGEFTIKLNNELVITTSITILDVFGKEIQTITNPQTTNYINLSSQPAGIYIVRIFSGHGWINEKIIKE